MLILSCLLFLVTIWVPAWLVAWAALRRWGVEETLALLAGGGLAGLTLTGLYLARTVVPFAPAFDVMLMTLGVVVLWRLRSGSLITKNVLVAGLGGRDTAWFLVVALPLFILPRLGHEVRMGNEVGYYGLLFIDFGNLCGVVNLLASSTGIPMAFVDGSGPFAYHWFFFALPAWMCTFLGVSCPAEPALTLATLVAAFWFFKVVSRVCARALYIAGWKEERGWCGWGAAIAIACSSVSYYYAFSVRMAGSEHFGYGFRNHLLMGLYNSFNIFGNNTAAIGLVFIAFLALAEWSERGARVHVWLSAVACALLPGYSATLAPTAGLAIAAAALLGLLRRGWWVLGAHLLVGGVVLGVYAAMGMFGRTAESPVLSFDGGQFLQNVVLMYLPGVIACLWAWRLWRDPLAGLLALAVASALLIASAVEIRGGHQAGGHLSMKNATLIQACLSPFLIVELRRLVQRGGARRWLAAAIVAASAANTTAYAVYPLLFRLQGKPPMDTVVATHFDALNYIEKTTPRTARVLDAVGLYHLSGDPLFVVGGRRAVLASDYSVLAGMVTDEIRDRRRIYERWAAAGFPSGEDSLRLAGISDYLIVAKEVAATDWRSLASFGEVRVYQSRRAVPRG